MFSKLATEKKVDEKAKADREQLSRNLSYLSTNENNNTDRTWTSYRRPPVKVLFHL